MTDHIAVLKHTLVIGERRPEHDDEGYLTDEEVTAIRWALDRVVVLTEALRRSALMVLALEKVTDRDVYNAALQSAVDEYDREALGEQSNGKVAVWLDSDDAASWERMPTSPVGELLGPSATRVSRLQAACREALGEQSND